MSQTVEVQTPQGVQTLEFPDEASEETIRSAIKRDFGSSQPKSSAVGAAGRGFLGGLLPTGAAVGAGALSAAGLEAALGPESLGASLLAIPPTIAAGYLAGKLQGKAIHKYAPKIEAQQQADVEQHPVASAVGEVASGLPFMEANPGALIRNPKSAVIPAAIGATVGAVSPLLEGQKPTVKDVAEGVAFSTLYGRPRFKSMPKATAAAAKAIGEKNAREIGEAKEVHGDLSASPGTGKGKVPAKEGSQGVQPQGKAQTGELGLNDEEQAYLDAERESIDRPVEVITSTPRGVRGLRALRSGQHPNAPRGLQEASGGDVALPPLSPEPASNNDLFAARQVARPNRQKGTIEINPGEFSEWLRDIPDPQKAQAVRSMLAEERIHLVVSDKDAGDYWKNLTAIEKASERKAYTNDWRGRHPGTGETISDTLMGHEAVRRRLQQLARMPTTEVAALAGREKWTLQGVEALSRIVRTLRETLGTKSSQYQLALIGKIQTNLEAARAASTANMGEPAALRRPEKDYVQDQLEDRRAKVAAIGKQLQSETDPERIKALSQDMQNHLNDIQEFTGKLGPAGEEQAFPGALRRKRDEGQREFGLKAFTPGEASEKPSATELGAAAKTAAEGNITPEDIFFREEASPEESGADITERKKRQDRLRGKAILDIPEELRNNPRRLAYELTQDGRVSGGTVEDTRRVTALVNKKTKEVALVSTFLRGKRGLNPEEAWLRNPNSQIEGNKRLADVSKDWTPTHSFLLAEPRTGFIQTWPDVQTFEREFVEPSREVLEGRLAAPEPLSDAPYWPGQGKGATAKLGAPITESEGILTGHMTPEEALAPIEHIEGETGKFESPQDVIDSMDAVTADIRRGTGTSPSLARRAYARLLAELDRKHPKLTNEQKRDQIARFIFDNHRSAPDAETFIRRTVEATGRTYLPGTAPNVPGGVGQGESAGRELTMPRFARTEVPTEGGGPARTPQPGSAVGEARPRGPMTTVPTARIGTERQPSTLGQEFPRRQATTEGFPPKELPPLLKRSDLASLEQRMAEQRRAEQEAKRPLTAENYFEAESGKQPGLKIRPDEPAALRARVKEARDELSIVGDNLKAIFQRHGTKQDLSTAMDAQSNASKNIATAAKESILLASGEPLSRAHKISIDRPGGYDLWAEAKGKRTEAEKRREGALAVKQTMHGTSMLNETPDINKLDTFQQWTENGILKAEGMLKSVNPVVRKQARKDVAYGKRLLEGINYARDHWNDPAFQDATDAFVREMNDQLLAENAHGIDTNWRQGQVPGYYENDGFFSDHNVIFGRRGILGTAFGKPKVFKNIYEAFSTGGHFRLASLDAADIANHRISRGQYAIGQALIENKLKTTMDPASKKPIVMDMQPIMKPAQVDITDEIEQATGTRPGTPQYTTKQVPSGESKVPQGHPEYVPVNIGTGRTLAVRRGYESFVRSAFGTSGLDTLEIMDVPVGRAAMEASRLLKHQMLLLWDTFHPGRLLQYSQALKPGTKAQGGWAATHYREDDLPRAVAQGYIDQEAADWALKKHPVKIGPRTEQWTMQRMINELLVGQGLNSAHNRDVLLEASAARLPIIGQKWHNLIRPYNAFLFERLVPGLMNEVAGRRLVEMQAKYPNADAKALARDIVKDTNVFFGNMGRQGIFRNRLFSDLATTTFLAPRWLEGLVQKELRFASRLSGLSYALGRRGPGYFGLLGEGMAKGLGAYFLGTQIANLVSRGHFTWENEEEGHKMDAWIPWGENGFWLSPLAVFAEVTHDIIRLSETKPRIMDALKQFGENRLGPIGKMEQILRTSRSPSGEYYSTSGGELKGALSELAPAPVSLGPLLHGAAHWAAPNIFSPPQPGSVFRQVVAGSAGTKVESGKSVLQQVVSKARDFAVREGYSKETGWKEMMTDEPSYSKLRGALRNNDQKEAKRQWAELRKAHTEDQIVHAMKLWAKRPLTGSKKGERAFIYSLSDRDLERYWKANDQRMAELDKFYDFYSRQ